MDPFQLRLSFLSTLKRLSASQSSIHASLSFLTTHVSSRSDLWSCLLETCTAASLNTRINLLFLISSLFTDETHSNHAVRSAYTPLLQRDAASLVDLMVPEARWEAVLNIDATRQVLSTWRLKLVLESPQLDQLEALLEERRDQLYHLPKEEREKRQGWSENEVVRRVEEDRERHKRLRENLWILPPTSTSQSVLFGVEPHHINPLFLASASVPLPSDNAAATSMTKVSVAASWTGQDVEFDQAWDQTSDWNSDDDERIAEENEKAVLTPVSEGWLRA